MNTRKLARFATVALVLSAAVLPACGSEVGKNIALGKKYTVSMKPNYSLTKDAGDMTQLTDGQFVKLPTSKDIYWTKKAAVGWSSLKLAPLAIAIDLERVEPIDSVVFSSAARQFSGIVWPMVISVQVSENGRDFYEVGNLVRISREPIPNVKEHHTLKFRADGLKTKGRYVMFVVLNSLHIQCDEIEVYRGDDSLLNEPIKGNRISLGQLMHPDRLTQEGCARRFHMDLSDVGRRLKKVKLDKDTRLQVKQEMASIQDEIINTRFPKTSQGFKAIVPFNDLHRRILGLNTHVLKAKGFDGLTVWTNDRYAPLQTMELPERQENPKISISSMQNEHRADVFNLTNATDKEMVVAFRLEGFDASFVAPHQVEFVDTREGVVHGTALVKMTAKDGLYTTTVPSGMTRQIWLETHTRGVKAGDYKGKIVITAGEVKKSVPFEVAVYPLMMPDRLDLEAGIWDFAAETSYLVTKMNHNQCVEDLRSHHVNLPWGSSWQIMLPRAAQFDDAGNMIKDMDYTAFDKWVKERPEAKRYMVYMAATSNSKFAQKFVRGTKEFHNAVGQWAAAFEKHNRSLGLKAGRVTMHFVDEPHGKDQMQAIIDWSKAVRSTTTDFDLFTDPLIASISDNDWPLFEEMLKQLDIVCPTASQYLRTSDARKETFQKFISSGKTMWFYMCSGPVRNFDPTYYRLQPWYAFSVNGSGSSYWAYGDGRCKTSWNEYPAVGKIGFTPLYLSEYESTVTPGKHWEAYREGAQDYQYLKMLQADAGKSDMAAPLGARVALEYSRVARNGYNWVNGKACAKADDIRIRILELLSKKQ